MWNGRKGKILISLFYIVELRVMIIIKGINGGLNIIFNGDNKLFKMS